MNAPYAPGILPVPAVEPDATRRNADRETEALAELHTRLIDTIAGYDKVLEKAEPEFKPVAAEFRALHIRHAAAVAEMLASDGHDPEQDGSVFGTVNRAVVELRSWFDAISHNILDALANGETHVLEAFDEAIGACVSCPERQRILAEQRAELALLLDRHAG